MVIILHQHLGVIMMVVSLSSILLRIVLILVLTQREFNKTSTMMNYYNQQMGFPLAKFSSNLNQVKAQLI